MPGQIDQDVATLPFVPGTEVAMSSSGHGPLQGRTAGCRPGDRRSLYDRRSARGRRGTDKGHCFRVEKFSARSSQCERSYTK